jgi:hypothetical protein
MESRFENTSMEREEGLFQLGKKIIKRAVKNEEDIVKEFLNRSPNYQKLKKIIAESKESKNKGGIIFGSHSLFQQIVYQVSPEEEKMIDDLLQAKTFNALFNQMSITDDAFNSPYAVPVLNGLGKIAQKANFGSYLIALAKETKDYAFKNLYSIDYPKQTYNYK